MFVLIISLSLALHPQPKCIHFCDTSVTRLFILFALPVEKDFFVMADSTLGPSTSINLEEYQNLFEERQIASLVFVPIYKITLLA